MIKSEEISTGNWINFVCMYQAFVWKKGGISKMQINYLLFNANETESSIKYRLFFIGYRFVNSTLLALFMEERKWSFVIPCYTALNTK